jgi:hypothetical protein
MKIDITPDRNMDFQFLGVAQSFDRHTFPGFVLVKFENGAEVKLPMAVFEDCRFLLKEKTALVSSGPGLMENRYQKNAILQEALNTNVLAGSSVLKR